MRTIRSRGIRLRMYPRDHPQSRVPHVHAWIGSGEVIVELMPDHSVRLSEQHPRPLRGNVKRSEVNKALAEAARCYDLLMAEYERQV
jgi:hypothetical protein